MEAITDKRIKKAVNYHEVIHTFHSGRGMGTDIMYLKLAQEMASVDQDPLLLVSMDLIKSYKNLDRGQLLKTLEGYGAGPKIWGMLAEF